MTNERRSRSTSTTREFSAHAEDSRGAFRFGAEVPIALVLTGILFVILVPLPAAVLDLLLIVNFTISLMVLFTAASASRPMDLSVFPSLLLVVTFFRLALNVATTRLILGNGEAGATAAGKVISAFAQFVAGNHVVVGLVVFGIIMVVQFVVITKGSTRISEVAARFTLDAMPGKQLSIDSDLNAGFIDDEQARELRKEIGDQADFYGAMDGASKFVRGEAMAGFIITLVNIVGGLCLGILYHGMSIVDAASVFTRLTIGDGLVTQIPALMVSVAAALLVTKNASSRSFVDDLDQQLFGNLRVFFSAAGFLFLLFVLRSGLPSVPLLGGTAVCVWMGLRQRALATPDVDEDFDTVLEVSQDGEAESGTWSGEEAAHEDVRSLLAVAPFELELGYRLVRLVDENRGGDLMERLAKVRKRIALDLGLVVPPVQVRDNVRLRASEYSWRIRGNAVGLWRLWPDRFFVTARGEPLEGVQGVEGTDPSTGEAGLWADESQWSLVASAGYHVRRIEEMIPAHFERIVRRHAAELLTRDEVFRLLGDLKERAPALVGELVPGALRLGDLHRVLQNLLREGVSIRDLETILEAVAEHVHVTRDTDTLTEYARRALSRSICAAVADRGKKIHAALLSPGLEEYLETARCSPAAKEGIPLEPEVLDTIKGGAMEALARTAEVGGHPVLVCAGSLRLQVRQLLSDQLPETTVLGYEEIRSEFTLEVVETVALEDVRQRASS